MPNKVFSITLKFPLVCVGVLKCWTCVRYSIMIMRKDEVRKNIRSGYFRCITHLKRSVCVIYLCGCCILVCNLSLRNSYLSVYMRIKIY